MSFHGAEKATLSCNDAETGKNVIALCIYRIVRHVMVQRHASLSCHNAETG